MYADRTDEAINKIREIIKSLDLKCEEVMERPKNDIVKNYRGHEFKLSELNRAVFRGEYMHTHQCGPVGGDIETWNYPDGVEAKIKDDRDYTVWYDYHDAADPADFSSWYTVYYVEERSANKVKLRMSVNKMIDEMS